ncbi:RDD family protein [Streptomyces albipurpureus]|uniref:RDD family protein n=1 Tax=Streptomyces albipurpureus TaxID=2897419 RepID=A0ABT0UR05_9ACTN|nr:RDD family protein [Streptomyces sp. CWNU-1]MCM2390055.1 RDD family protein [Streptomyces sp. CWNU-1]
MSALVTGDAVVLGLQPAKLPSRALALAIDMVVVWGLYLGISIGLTLATSSLDQAAGMALAIASFVLVLVGAPIAVETLSRGRSLGKLACGLRVVRDDGGPIRFRHALVRGAMGVVEILMTFGVVACIASLVSARGRRIGDVFAGTLVIRERVPAGREAVVPPPPPWLVGRFAELDLSAVPDELWLAIRQYLTRMGQLDPAVSWSMAERLAGDLSARTGAPAPGGVQPAAYLAAVVNERQAREARRAFGVTASAAPRGTAGAASSDVTRSEAASGYEGTPGGGKGQAAETGGAGWMLEPHPDSSGTALSAPARSELGGSRWRSAAPVSLSPVSLSPAQPELEADGPGTPPASTGFAPPA